MWGYWGDSGRFRTIYQGNKFLFIRLSGVLANGKLTRAKNPQRKARGLVSRRGYQLPWIEPSAISVVGVRCHARG